MFVLNDTTVVITHKEQRHYQPHYLTVPLAPIKTYMHTDNRPTGRSMKKLINIFGSPVDFPKTRLGLEKILHHCRTADSCCGHACVVVSVTGCEDTSKSLSK